MSPYEMSLGYLDKMLVVANKFGWERTSYIQQHERDWDSKSTVNGWKKDGKWLINDSELSPALVDELYRITKG